MCLSIDSNECSVSPAPCDVNANCQNNVGSYLCSCKAGFTGDGKTCQGKHHNTNLFWTSKRYLGTRITQHNQPVRPRSKKKKRCLLSLLTFMQSRLGLNGRLNKWKHCAPYYFCPFKQILMNVVKDLLCLSFGFEFLAFVLVHMWVTRQ